MGLLAPLARVSMADDEWYTGDGVLSAVEVSIGEQDRSNSCSFSLSDYNGAIAAKYFEVSFEQGGIEVPPTLLSSPKASSSPSSAITATGTGGSVTIEDASPYMKAMLDTIAWAEGADYNVRFGGDTFDNGYSDHPRLSAGFAGGSSDAAGRYQFLGTTWDEQAAKLGLSDFSPENQDNAAIDLIVSKRGAGQQVESGDIRGALETLSYEWASLPPYRYPGQGTKTLEQVEQYWADRVAFYEGSAPPEPAEEDEAPPAQPEIADAATTQPSEVSQRGTEIIIEMGFEVDQLVAYHFIHTGTKYNRIKQETVFEGKAVRYILARRNRNTSYENITLRELAQGVCDRFRLTLEMEGDGPTYQHLDQTGISDYQLLMRECKAAGFYIKEHEDVLVIKPYRAEFTGFVINHENCIDLNFTDQASADRIIPAPDSVTTRSAPTTDASENTSQIDRLTGEVLQEHTEDTTGTGGDREGDAATTGSPDQAITGTPQQGEQGTGVAGVAFDDFVPTLPQSEVISEAELKRLKEQGFTDQQIQDIYRRQAFAQEKENAANAEATVFSSEGDDAVTVEDEISSITEIPDDFDLTLLIGEEELAKLEENPVLFTDTQRDELYLKRYKQWLRDNKEDSEESESSSEAGPSGSDSRSEAHRIGMGYQSSAELVTLPSTLVIEPGSIIAISNTIVPEVFAREWRVSQVKHSLSTGGMRTTMDFYSPVAVKDTGNGTSTTVGSNSIGPLAPGSWVMPAEGPVGDGIGARSPTRNHNGIDVATAGPMLASGDGVVVAAFPGNAPNNGDGSNGGAGNMIVIEHAGSVFTRYMHLAPGSFTVSEGDQVTAGQQIGVCGNSGRSFGAHAHVEWRRGSQTGTVALPSEFGIVITQDMLSDPGDWNRFKY